MSTTVLEELVEMVREDPELTPKEKETMLRFGKVDDRVTVFTAEASLVRRLLQHPEFEPDYYVPETGAKVESAEALIERDTALVGMGGTLPIGALKVRASARSTDRHAPIISPGTGRE